MIGAAARPGWAGSALVGSVGLERQVPEQLKTPKSGTQCCEWGRESAPFLVVKHLFL